MPETVYSLVGRVLVRLDRDLASRNAEMAREIARPGEPHAKARERIRRVQREIDARMTHVLLYGEDPGMQASGDYSVTRTPESAGDE